MFNKLDFGGVDMDMIYKKPPLGVIPKEIWKETRILEPTRAIYEYSSVGDYKTIKKWVSELQQLLTD
jgi:hypothetical protein